MNIELRELSLKDERLWAKDHQLCQTEADFIETMGILDRLSADKIIFMHIEEVDGLDHETLGKFVTYYANGRDWQVGYDTMQVEI